MQIDPIQYGKLQDPPVQNWNNVAFADTYYQDSTTDNSAKNTLAFAVNGAAAVFATIEDPKAKLEEIRNSVKDLALKIKADAQQRFATLVQAAETNAKGAFDQFVTNFGMNASTTLMGIQTTVSKDVTTAFTAVLNQAGTTAQDAAMKLSQQLGQNTTTAVGDIYTTVYNLVNTTVSQFVDSTVDTVNTRS